MLQSILKYIIRITFGIAIILLSHIGTSAQSVDIPSLREHRDTFFQSLLDHKESIRQETNTLQVDDATKELIRWFFDNAEAQFIISSYTAEGMAAIENAFTPLMYSECKRYDELLQFHPERPKGRIAHYLREGKRGYSVYWISTDQHITVNFLRMRDFDPERTSQAIEAILAHIQPRRPEMH